MPKLPERLGTLESRWTLVDGLPMHARVSVDPVPEDRLPVILVHGFIVSSRYLLPTAVRLAPYHRVYVPDMPGFGKSENPDHVLTLRELADALAHWMHATGIRRAAVLGHSFGCQVVADFAVRYPERVERAVLAGLSMDPTARTTRQQIGRWLVNSPQEPPSMGLVLARDLLDAGPRRTIREFQYALQDRIETNLPQMRMPTLVVRGERDPFVPRRWAEEATHLLPQGACRVIRGAAHTVNFTAPKALARIVRAFLQAPARHQDEPFPPEESSAAA